MPSFSLITNGDHSRQFTSMLQSGVSDICRLIRETCCCYYSAQCSSRAARCHPVDRRLTGRTWSAQATIAVGQSAVRGCRTSFGLLHTYTLSLDRVANAMQRQNNPSEETTCQQMTLFNLEDFH